MNKYKKPQAKPKPKIDRKSLAKWKVPESENIYVPDALFSNVTDFQGEESDDESYTVSIASMQEGLCRPDNCDDESVVAVYTFSHFARVTRESVKLEKIE